MSRNRTVAMVGFAVAVSGSTADALLEHLLQTTDETRLRPDIAYLVECLKDVSSAWRAGAMSASGHADMVRAQPAAESAACRDEVTTDEAGRLLGLGARQVRRLADSGTVRSRRAGQTWLLSRTDVLALLEERRDAEAG